MRKRLSRLFLRRSKAPCKMITFNGGVSFMWARVKKVLVHIVPDKAS